MEMVVQEGAPKQLKDRSHLGTIEAEVSVHARREALTHS
jgi:hypothetical protein